MSVNKNRVSKLARVISILFLGFGILSSTGTVNVAQAARADSVTVKSISHITGKKAKSVKKASLRRFPSKKRLTVKTTRRYRGLHPRLRLLLATVGRHYGRRVVISSGCRSRKHNRRVGGARRSMHLSCKAADIKVAGVSKARLRRYVARLSGRGGVGTYCGRSIVHLDVGPTRSWAQGCRKRKRRLRKS